MAWFCILAMLAALVRAKASPGAGSTIQDIVDKAIAASATYVQLPSGVWQFERDLVIERASNLEIDATATELSFRLYGANTSSRTPVSTGLRFIECSNVSFSGIPGSEASIDYNPPPFWQGSLRVRNPPPLLQDELVVSTDDGFVDFDEWWGGMRNWSSIVAVFWDGTEMSLQEPAGVHSWEFAPRNVTAQPLGECVEGARDCFALGWAFDWQSPSDGSKLTISALTGYTLNIANSSGVTVRDVNVFGSPNKAITEFDGLGGHLYERVRLVRRPGTSRLLAAASDAFHSAGTQTGPTLRDCEFSWSGDDFFNVHNTLQLLLETDPTEKAEEDAGIGANLIIVEPLLSPDNVAVYGLNSAYGTAVQFEHATPGQSLSLYPPPSMHLGVTVTVTAKPELVTDPSIIARAKALAGVVSARGLPLAWSFGVRVWRISVAEAPTGDASAPGTFVSMDQWSARGTSITSNYFHDGFCTAGRIKCPECSITDNRFERAVIHRLVLSPAPNWAEGPMTAPNMTFADNSVTGCGTSPLLLVPQWTPGLLLRNNTFTT